MRGRFFSQKIMNFRGKNQMALTSYQLNEVAQSNKIFGLQDESREKIKQEEETKVNLSKLLHI